MPEGRPKKVGLSSSWRAASSHRPRKATMKAAWPAIVSADFGAPLAILKLGSFTLGIMPATPFLEQAPQPGVEPVKLLVLLQGAHRARPRQRDRHVGDDAARARA